MADINVQALYNQKEREFKVQGAGLERFGLDFIAAVNRTARRINTLANLADQITPISNTESGTTLGIDEKYEPVVSDGVSLFMMKMGQRPVSGQETNMKTLKDEFEEGIGSIEYDIRNIAQLADTDDDTTDTIGLGALG